MDRVIGSTLLLVISLAGCGTLGAGDGGADDLPNRGVIPYERPLDMSGAPLIVLHAPEEGVELHEPSAVVRGGAIDLYFELRSAGSSSIAVARSTDGLEFGAAEPLFAGRAPSAIWAGDTCHLVFVTPNGALEHATSTDGRHFVFDPQPLPIAAAGADAPSLAVLPDGGFELVYAVTSTATGLPAIARASASDAALRFDAAGTILSAGTGCTGTDGKPAACWDGAGVTSPELRISTTVTGRRVHRLFYGGLGEGDARGLGFAAWFEGSAAGAGIAERFPYNPVVDAKNVAEGEPTNVRDGDRYLLYFREERGIAVAIDARGVPSETF